MLNVVVCDCQVIGHSCVECGLSLSSDRSLLG